jgi:hypothetical protein
MRATAAGVLLSPAMAGSCGGPIPSINYLIRYSFSAKKRRDRGPYPDDCSKPKRWQADPIDPITVEDLDAQSTGYRFDLAKIIRASERGDPVGPIVRAP